MKNKGWILLKTLFLSTSLSHALKKENDKKKLKKERGAKVGRIIIYAMLAIYFGAAGVGLGLIGMGKLIPALAAGVLFSMMFLFTVFKAGGYIFTNKDLDMLMAMPLPIRSIVTDKFIYMYVKSLPMPMVMVLSLGAGLIVSGDFSVWQILMYIVLSFAFSLIPMALATLLSLLIAGIGSNFKYKQIALSILTFILIMPTFFIRFIIEDVVRNNKIDAIVQNTESAIGGIENNIFLVRWFDKAVCESNVLLFVLLIVISVAVVETVMLIISVKYRSIISRLETHAIKKNFKLTKMKKRSAVGSIAYKEFKRFTGSSTYMINIGMGFVISLLIGFAALIVKADKLIALIFQGAPITAKMLVPAIPFIVYFMNGMVATTCCSPSLEGKNSWIVDSMPIAKKTLWQGKMRFNLLLMVPASVVTVICLCISGRIPFVDSFLCIGLEISLCLFSTVFGCVCGVKHMKTDWENEVEIIKQGAAVSLYILPNMFITMGLAVGTVFLGMVMNHGLILLLLTVVYSSVALLFYRKLMKLAKQEA